MDDRLLMDRLEEAGFDVHEVYKWAREVVVAAGASVVKLSPPHFVKWHQEKGKVSWVVIPADADFTLWLVEYEGEAALIMEPGGVTTLPLPSHQTEAMERLGVEGVAPAVLA